VPRRVKRTVNHLRLLLLVADKRHMFGGSPPLEAVHLAKWVVLLERWPELGRALRADPHVIAPIEDAADKNPQAMQDLLHRIAPEVTASADLAAFLRDETRLADLVERLIYYLPSQPPRKSLWAWLSETAQAWAAQQQTRQVDAAANEDQRQELPQEPGGAPVP
jgi:hypothetical protein